MVFPARRSLGTSQDDDTAPIPSEVHIPERNKRSASMAAFPETPHPQKRQECRDDTPPTQDTATLERSPPAEYNETVLVNEMESPPRNEEEQPPQDDLDWDKLAESEPARTDIPIFLSAMARKDAADERFARALDEAHGVLTQCVNDVLQTVADVHNAQREKMDSMEANIKDNLVSNDEARAQMQVRLQESATAAQGLFAKLLQRVTEPLQMMATTMQSSSSSEQQQQQGSKDDQQQEQSSTTTTTTTTNE